MAGDTIFALATTRGKGGIAIMRVSGPAAEAAAKALTGAEFFSPRYATLCRIAHQRPIDQGIVILFPAPASFTGEDVVEFHLHGGPAIAVALSDALTSLDCRQAEPGEFTKRAFLNGRIDLTEAEAIADLVDAETESQHIQALAQAEGGLRDLYEDWSDRLTKALAYLEASLDFADEELPEIMPAVLATVADLLKEVSAHLNEARRGERLRDGVRIAILGAPNAGKSSLLNELAGRDVAIVSERAGTTRDILEVHLNLGGYAVRLADTAGLRETTDDIEAEGIARALKWSETADLKLFLVDPTSLPCPDIKSLQDDRTMIVLTKSDLLPPGHEQSWVPGDAISISVNDGAGIADLLSAITSRVSAMAGIPSCPPTRERHRLLLQDVVEALMYFQSADGIDLASEDLRYALRNLGRLTGRVDTEALLDIIFRDFCVGK